MTVTVTVAKINGENENMENAIRIIKTENVQIGKVEAAGVGVIGIKPLYSGWIPLINRGTYITPAKKKEVRDCAVYLKCTNLFGFFIYCACYTYIPRWI